MRSRADSNLLMFPDRCLFGLFCWGEDVPFASASCVEFDVVNFVGLCSAFFLPFMQIDFLLVWMLSFIVSFFSMYLRFRVSILKQFVFLFCKLGGSLENAPARKNWIHGHFVMLFVYMDCWYLFSNFLFSWQLLWFKIMTVCTVK